MNAKTIIALDLGATKCAAGIIEYHPETLEYVCKRTYSINLAVTTSLEDLLQKTSAGLCMPFTAADAICIGAAGQYNGRELHHLEGVYPYPMNIADVARNQRWGKYAVIHDYDTVVCATFTSYMQHPGNVMRLNNCIPDPHKRRVALGLGTGLGMKDAILLQNGDFWLGKNEIGHIGIIHPPHTDDEHLSRHLEFMRFLLLAQKNQQTPITFESILTGRGLVNLHQFLYSSNEPVSPEIIGEQMKNGSNPELLDLFSWYLGLFIGSIQLIFMPEGGIWMTGGVAMKHLEIFSQPAFINGIHATPAFQHVRDSYPIGVLTNPEHALIGAGFYAVRRMLTPVTLSSSLP